MPDIIELNGKKYVRQGDKLIEIDHFNEDGQPVISCWSEEKTNEQGGTDCIIHVNCLQIASSAPRT